MLVEREILQSKQRYGYRLSSCTEVDAGEASVQ